MENQDVDYLNKTVWAKPGVSKIHGVGIFAIRDIPKGTAFTDYNIYHHKIGEPKMFKMDEKEFRKLEPSIQSLVLDRVLLPIGQKIITFFSPNHEIVLQGFLNHSDNPNTDGHITLKDIKEGEELTEDYANIYDDKGINEINLKNFNPNTWKK